MKTKVNLIYFDGNPIAILIALILLHVSFSARGNESSYRVRFTEPGSSTCFIYYKNAQGSNTKGVREDHLQKLENLPGSGGAVAEAFISKFFDLEINDQDTPGSSEFFHKPKTADCTQLNKLRIALNTIINNDTQVASHKAKSNKTAPTQFDLICKSEDGVFKHGFLLNSSGDLDWTFLTFQKESSSEQGRYQSWGTEPILIQTQKNSQTPLCLRNEESQLKLCIPSNPKSGESFNGTLESLRLDSLTIDQEQQLTCRASKRFFKIPTIEKSLERLRKTPTMEEKNPKSTTDEHPGNAKGKENESESGKEENDQLPEDKSNPLDSEGPPEPVTHNA